MKSICFFSLCCLLLFACNDIRVSVGGQGVFTLSLYELWAYLLLLPMYAYILPIARHHQFKKQHPILFSSPTIWLLLYVLWGVFPAVLFREDPNYTIQIDYKKILPGVIAYLGILLFAVKDQRKIRLIQLFWFIAGFFNIVVALSQYFFSSPYFIQYSDSAAAKLSLTGDALERIVVGFGSSPNMFAQIIMPWFVVAAIVWLTRRNFLTKNSFLWFFLSILFGFVLFTTASKGALLWSTAGIFLGLAMTKRKLFRSSLWLIVMAFAIIVFINTLAVYYFNSPLGESLDTLRSRIDLIITCWRLLLDHPLNALLGGGLEYWEQYAYYWATWQFYDAHNVYLNQILMYGLVGLFLFSAFILSCVRRGLHKSEIIHSGLLSPIPYIGALFAILGEYWFEPSFKDAIQKYQLLFVLSMLLVVSNFSYHQTDEPFNKE